MVVSCWPRAGSSQSDGSEASRSRSAAFERLSSTSKELLRRRDALGEVFELFDVVAHGLAMLQGRYSDPAARAILSSAGRLVNWSNEYRTTRSDTTCACSMNMYGTLGTTSVMRY